MELWPLLCYEFWKDRRASYGRGHQLHFETVSRRKTFHEGSAAHPPAIIPPALSCGSMPSLWQWAGRRTRWNYATAWHRRLHRTCCCPLFSRQSYQGCPNASSTSSISSYHSSWLSSLFRFWATCSDNCCSLAWIRHLCSARVSRLLSFLPSLHHHLLPCQPSKGSIVRACCSMKSTAQPLGLCNRSVGCREWCSRLCRIRANFFLDFGQEFALC